MSTQFHVDGVSTEVLCGVLQAAHAGAMRAVRLRLRPYNNLVIHAHSRGVDEEPDAAIVACLPAGTTHKCTQREVLVDIAELHAAVCMARGARRLFGCTWRQASCRRPLAVPIAC